jgi:transposase
VRGSRRPTAPGSGGFLTRFKGQGLEVALEATTGWRFLAEELDRIGADVHLAEVVQTRGLQGRGKRPKTDWADARHLRELLLIGRLPESWIAPAHLLDLRARVRCRHTLVHQRTECQQRMHAVLYHHGAPHSRKLLSLENRTRLAALKLPAAAQEQLTIALEMIDAIDLQLGPFDLSLRAYARRQPGCRTLIDQIYGVGSSITTRGRLLTVTRMENANRGANRQSTMITPVALPAVAARAPPTAPMTPKNAVKKAHPPYTARADRDRVGLSGVGVTEEARH